MDLHGGMVVARFLVERQVAFLFTLCGGHISPILVAAKTAGIRIVDMRHEANAVFAADAVSSPDRPPRGGRRDSRPRCHQYHHPL